MAKKQAKKSGGRKPTARKSTSSPRKTSRASTAKKKSLAKKSASKKKSVRKSTAKKAPSRKSTASTARKPTAKKPATKSSKKAAEPKASAAPSKKTKSGSKSAAAPAAKPAKSGKSSKSAKSAKQSTNSDASVAASTITLTDARAAASRLAAAAGLPSLKMRTPEVIAELVAEKKLTKTPLNKRDLDKYRDILELKRSEVAGDVSDMESEALGQGKGELSSLPQHMADQGSDEYEQSLSLGLAQSQRGLLKEIDAALARIEAKTYGICEALGVPIPKERLDATPWTRYSVEGARMVDRGVRPS